MSSVMVPTAEAGHRPSTSSNRRSVTVPTKLNGSVGNMTIDSTEPDGRVEMLFMCPSTKVISFSPRSNSTWSSSGERGGKGQKSETTGSLPWSSPTERTLASGILNIYRLLESSFLQSGDMVKPVLPRSQCWCIDGNSIFALRVRADTYYRIELPYETEEDKKFAEELKSVFASILRYEKTACPFMRGFDVENPESDEIIPRSGRWKNTEKARRWTLNRIWKPEDEPDYIPACDRVMSPLTKEAKGGFKSRRNWSLKEDHVSEGIDNSNDETISSIANSLSRSKSVQQDWLASSPLLVRRTRSVTPPHAKHSTSSFDARRRPFLKSAAKRPISMYDVSSPLNSLIPKEQSDTQNTSDSSSNNRSYDVENFMNEELSHEDRPSQDYASTLSEPTEEFETSEVPKTTHVEDRPMDEDEKEPPVEILETKTSPSESPPLTPPPLSGSEDSFSPTWTEEIITPPDTLRVRQAVTRPQIEDPQSTPPSPTSSVSDMKSDDQGPKQQVDSFTCSSLSVDSGTEFPPETAMAPAATAVPNSTIPSTPTPSTATLPTTPTTPTITTVTKAETETETATAGPPSSSSPTKLTAKTPSKSPADLKSILSSPQGRSLGLIQKAYIILVSPPTHVFALMYEIATRLAASSLQVADEEDEEDDDDNDDKDEGMRDKGQRRRQRRSRYRQRNRAAGEFFASGSLPGTWIFNDDGDDDYDDENENNYDVPSEEQKSWQKENGNGSGSTKEEEVKEQEQEREREREREREKERKGAAAAAIAGPSLSDVD